MRNDNDSSDEITLFIMNDPLLVKFANLKSTKYRTGKKTVFNGIYLIDNILMNSLLVLNMC